MSGSAIVPTGHVPQRIEAHPSFCIRREITKVLGDVAVGGLVQRDREYYGQRVNRDHLDEVEFQMLDTE